MTQYRQYIPEPLNGTPAPIDTAAQRRALIGRRIEWHDKGWWRKNSGTVQDASGRNILVDGDWKWAPHMHNVHVLEDKP